MTENHPITPPQWQVDAWCKQALAMGADVDAVFLEAARWGADHELDACCGLIGSAYVRDQVRAARRPKPSSLKEQALKALDHICVNHSKATDQEYTIRRALEQLDD